VPIFFVVTKLTLRLPPLPLLRSPPAGNRAHRHRLDVIAVRARFVYFYAGSILATRIFAIAATRAGRPW